MDEMILQEFLHRDYKRLVAGLSFMCPSVAVAEEFVQEALTRAYERSKRGESVNCLKCWVATVARNLARSGLRRARAESAAYQRLREVQGAFDRALDEPADVVEVLLAVRALRPHQREVIALRYFSDFSIAEIARVTGRHPEAVKGLLRRARLALGASLAVANPDEEGSALERP